MAVLAKVSDKKDPKVSKCRIDDSGVVHTAIEICDELKNAVAGKFIHNDYKASGLFNQITSNMNGGYGNRIYIKSGKYSGGVCLRYCPFCGEKLMSDEEAEMVQYQVDIELTRHKNNINNIGE